MSVNAVSVIKLSGETPAPQVVLGQKAPLPQTRPYGASAVDADQSVFGAIYEALPEVEDVPILGDIVVGVQKFFAAAGEKEAVSSHSPSVVASSQPSASAQPTEASPPLDLKQLLASASQRDATSTLTPLAPSMSTAIAATDEIDWYTPAPEYLQAAKESDALRAEKSSTLRADSGETAPEYGPRGVTALATHPSNRLSVDVLETLRARHLQMSGPAAGDYDKS